MPERSNQKGQCKANPSFSMQGVSASIFHCCADMHTPNSPASFPLKTIDSKHDFINSNPKKDSYNWDLMHNSVPHVCKIYSCQNVLHPQFVDEDEDVLTQSLQLQSIHIKKILRALIPS
jgi:hypothetical protein